MRAAAILGLGCSSADLKPFQTDNAVEWRVGMPASSDDADIVLLFGGDGTIHRHLSQLVKLGLPVLVVPAGSGNDFARALGIRRRRDSLAAWWKFRDGGNVRRIDLGVVTPVENTGGARQAISHESPHPRYFCCVAGVGLDGEVAARANRLPHWLRGHGGYALSLVPAIFTFTALTMKISVGGEDGNWVVRSHQETLLAAFANTPLYGGGMRIAPRAKMDDGLLDVCAVGAVGAFRLLRLFPRVYSGRHLTVPEVEYFQAQRVRVETEHPIDVYADGEFVGRTPVEVRIEPAALKVVVP